MLTLSRSLQPRLRKVPPRNRTILSSMNIKATVAGLCLVSLCTGCASFTTTQRDIRFEDGKPSTEISTEVTSRTLFSSKSDLSKFHASQTEKTQGATVGSLTQQGGTNTAEVLREATKLIEALGIRGATGL